jgi:hypothetical protein
MNVQPSKEIEMKTNDQNETAATQAAADHDIAQEVCIARYDCDAGGPDEDGGHKFNSGPDIGNPDCERCGLDAITWTLLCRPGLE